MKKVLSVALLAAMLISAGSIHAFAEETDPTKINGEAGIIFEEGEDPGIYPPEPGDPNLHGTALRFGTWEINTKLPVAVYDSLDEDQNIAEDDRYAGLRVVNPYGDRSWKVTADISPFKLRGSEQETIKGFALELIHDGDFHGDFDQSKAPTVPGSIILKHDPEESTVVPVLEGTAGGYAGTFGVNYSGELSVLRGTAHEGDAYAVITWNYESTPTGGPTA